MDKPVRGLAGRRFQERGGVTHASVQIREDLIDGALRQADASPELLQDVARNLIKRRPFAVNGQSDILIEPVIERGIDDIVGR